MPEEKVIDERQGWTSASNAEADELCPGRHLAQKGIVEPPKDSDRDFGIRVHDALEKDSPIDLTPTQLDAYEECKEVERAALRKYFGAYVAERLRPAVREHRLWLDIPPRFRHSGRLDTWYRHADKGMVIDYKALRGEVTESPSNKQLRDQSVLLYGNVPLLSEVAVAIAQPPSIVEPVVAVYGAMDLALARDELYKRVRASNDPNSPRVAGEVQCHFCLAKGSCPAYAAWQASRMPVQIPVSTKPALQWSPEEWSAFLEKASIAEKWLEETKQLAKGILVMQPDAIPGWRLGDTGSIDTVTDPQELFNRFAKLGGKLEDYMACLEVGKTKFKDALAKTTGAKGKSLASTLDTLLEGIISSKEKAKALRRTK
jgi:hypothetical protein